MISAECAVHKNDSFGLRKLLGQMEELSRSQKESRNDQLSQFYHSAKISTSDNSSHIYKTPNAIWVIFSLAFQLCINYYPALCIIWLYYKPCDDCDTLNYIKGTPLVVRKESKYTVIVVLQMEDMARKQ